MLNIEVFLPSLGRRLSSISAWTQRELAKSVRFTAIFLAMDRRIIAHLPFVSTATSNQPPQPTAVGSMHVYEVRPRKDHRGVDLISDALPFGRLWYDGPNTISNAVGCKQPVSLARRRGLQQAELLHDGQHAPDTPLFDNLARL